MAQPGPVPPGQWREHLPYNSTIDLATGDGAVIAATPYSLFRVQPATGEISRYSKITGLSETGISVISTDEAGTRLLIAYQNSNLDILYRQRIYNIPDIKRDNSAGDKTIYACWPLENKFYLSTGIGIIVVDAARYEISDTWQIGNGGNPVKVNGFTADAVYFYAATEQGLKRLLRNSTNPADYANWQTVSGSNGLPAGACQQVLNLGGSIILQQQDRLYKLQGSTWTLLYTDGWPVVNVHASENKLLISARQSNGISRIRILQADGTVVRTLENSAAVSLPRKALLLNNEPWVADQYAGLSRFGATATFTNYTLNAPQAAGSGEMLVYNQVFYASSGAVNDAWNYQYNGDGIFRLQEGEWTNINRYRFPVLDTLLDILSLAADKRDGTIWAGSYGGGLIHMKNGPSFELFKQGYLDATVGDPGSYRVAGLMFDSGNNLWISNFGAAQPLKLRKADGSWKSFTLPFPLFENALAQIIVDDFDTKWIVAPLGNGLVCFNHGTSPDNTGDDRWRKLGRGTGNGNLPSDNVQCLAKDKSGFIWVGTDNGIGVFQCPDQVVAAGCDAVWPVVPAGNFAGYLFQGQTVRSIATDGADRKWVATPAGVFLISASGEKVLEHFTEANSPLLSNDVLKIAIDGHSGEVYFATRKGTCSYRAEATAGGSNNEELLVFPNPVPPGFAGTIAIRGVVNNAIVKITELDGKLVYQTRALGGQAIWDGRNYRGQRISTGVYLVLVQEEGGKERAAAKIFFINR